MATTVTGGIKNVSWTDVDPVATPTVSVTGAASGTVTVSGTTVDLLSTNIGLPDEVWLKLYPSATITDGTATASAAPTVKVYALWMTATGSAAEVAAPDKDSHLLLNKAETTSRGIASGTAWTDMKPTNAVSFSPKGRYLKLRYKCVNPFSTDTKIKFGSKIAKVYGQGYSA